MKTAMQQLIPELIKLRGFGIEITDEYIQGLLEKEKEQIIEAFDFKRNNSHLTAFDEEYAHVGEEYYNQTYNQNK